MPVLRAGASRSSLGPQYRKLWAATAISTLGDGMYLTAVPLLAAQLTQDPLRLSFVFFAAWLPWPLFGLVSGALVDRWDRRRTMWAVDAFRFLVVVALTMAVVAGQVTIWLLATLDSCSEPGPPYSTTLPRRSSRRSSRETASSWSGPTANSAPS
jgi:MFS family permease